MKVVEKCPTTADQKPITFRDLKSGDVFRWDKSQPDKPYTETFKVKVAPDMLVTIGDGGLWTCQLAGRWLDQPVVLYPHAMLVVGEGVTMQPKS